VSWDIYVLADIWVKKILRGNNGVNGTAVQYIHKIMVYTVSEIIVKERKIVNDFWRICEF